MSESKPPTNPFEWLMFRAGGLGGALAIIGWLNGLVTLRGFALGIAELWAKHVTPIGDAAFGWLLDLSPIALPEWTTDYLLVGVTLALGTLRVSLYDARRGDPDPWWIVALFFVAALFIWPAYLAYLLWIWMTDAEIRKPGWLPSFYVLFEAPILATMLLAVSYALFFAP